MRIFFIRHGEAVKTASGSVLTPKGVAQAKNIAQFFDTIVCDVVLTSALTRSKQTVHEPLVNRTDFSFVETSSQKFAEAIFNG